MLLYITAVSGVMVTFHYCGQELESWNLYSDKSSCEDDSCGDEMDKNDSCCQDEVVVAKVNSDQEVLSFNELTSKISTADAVVGIQSIEVEYFQIQTHASVANSAHAPPELWQNIPLYKLYSSYTYYG